MRGRLTFDCAESDVSSEELIRTHSNAGDNSGREQEKLQAFRKFGFQLVIVATVQNAKTIQPYIDSVVTVSKTESHRPECEPARPSTVASGRARR